MSLFNLSKSELGLKANELNFVRDTLEKVLRLTDVLEYINSNPQISRALALKGGTAINLTVFDLPRLSVDIDLDYAVEEQTREEMMTARSGISNDIKTYMNTQGYELSQKSKFYHSLDSFVYTYKNRGDVNDNIKIEINYSLRSHIFEPKERAIVPDALSCKTKIYAIDPMEIFAGKLNALMSRSAPRDLYDVHNMIKYGLFEENERTMLRKSVVFYTAISQEETWQEYSTTRIDSITPNKIKTSLLPVVQKGEFVELNSLKKESKDFIEGLMVLEDCEKEFLKFFKKGQYKPELLFNDEKILKRIRNHPMALWKTQER